MEVHWLNREAQPMNVHTNTTQTIRQVSPCQFFKLGQMNLNVSGRLEMHVLVSFHTAGGTMRMFSEDRKIKKIISCSGLADAHLHKDRPRMYTQSRSDRDRLTLDNLPTQQI